jgi:hypothetical protein
MVKAAPPSEDKLVDNLEDVFERIPIRDGMIYPSITISATATA